MSARICIVIAGLLGGGGVTLGAYHAHGLEKALTSRGLDSAEVAKQMGNCEVAVRYQMYHALALLGLGIMLTRRECRLLKAAAVFCIVGNVLFSGGLYLMVFAGNMIHWAIVPVGGLCQIVGWALIAIAGLTTSFPADERATTPHPPA